MVIKILQDMFIALSLYAFVITFFEFLYTRGMESFTTRKLAHMSCGLISAALPFLTDKETAISIALCLALFVLLSKKLRIYRGIEIADESSLGTLMFPLGFILSIVLFWSINPVIYSGSVLILGFADSAAALIGRKYGTIKYKIFDQKTFEGSLTFITVSLLILLSAYLYNFGGFSKFNSGTLTVLLLGPVLISFVEAFSVKGIDNLFIPLVSGCILYLSIYL